MSMINILQHVFGMNNMQFQQQPQGPFRGKFHAYSPAFWNSENRDKLEKGDKIVVPASILEQVSRLQVSFPIMFRITHDSEILRKKSHCSVLEFTAEEGNVYLPLWMIDNLGLDPSGSSMVELETVTLQKGTFVQFQAHETKFAMLEDPRVVLENALRSYSALTVGDTIPVQFGKNVYKLDVTEVKANAPLGVPAAVSIIETDINVDFKEPKDYSQWSKKQKEMKEQTQKQLQTSSDNKYPEEKEKEEEDKDWVCDPGKDNDDKSNYFKELEQSGIKANTLKRANSSSLRKNLSSNSLSSSTTNTNTNTNNNKNSYSLPSKTRGAPLGSANKTKTVSIKSSKTTLRKEEEIVGNMRYIYEIDDLGNRTCIRKLPVRNNTWMDSSGHTLQD